MKNLSSLLKLTGALILAGSIAFFLTQIGTNKEGKPTTQSTQKNISSYSDTEALGDNSYNVHHVEVYKTLFDLKKPKVQAEFKSIDESITKKSSAIKPPISGMEPKAKVYKVNPAKGASLVSDYGSIITIPEYAFVNKEGEIVTDEIDLSYTEYNNVVDIFTSGIPMTFEANGKTEHFESAGMFKISASCNDEEVEIAEGKDIEVKVASIDADDDYNFYELDTNTGVWETKQNNLPVNTNNRTTGEWVMPEPKIDSTDFATRYASTEYFTNYRINQTSNRDIKKSKYLETDAYMPTKVNYASRYIRNSRRTPERIIYLKSAFKVKRLPREKNDSDDMIRFKVVTRSKYYRVPIHLRHFVNKEWIYNGELNRRDFYKEFSRLKRYNDVRVIYNEGNSEFTFELKSTDGFTKIGAYTYKDDPETVNSNDVKIATKQFARRYTRYVNYLNHFETVFNKSIRQHLDNIVNMRAAWKKYQDAQIVYRTVNLTNMGVYNCDRLMYIENPRPIVASFTNEDCGEEVEPASVFVFDKGANGMYTYSSNKITVDPKNTVCILVLEESGCLSYIKGEDVKEAFDGRRTHFVVKKTVSNSSEDLKKELGL